MEIYVDSEGIAHDDEGNSWQTNKSPGVYSHRELAPSKANRHKSKRFRRYNQKINKKRNRKQRDWR